MVFTIQKLLPQPEITQPPVEHYTLEPGYYEKELFKNLKGSIWLIGGQNPKNDAFLNTVLIYNISEEKLIKGKKLNKYRHGHGIAEYNNQIFVFGGLENEAGPPIGGGFLKGTVESYDLNKQEGWIFKKSMPRPLLDFSVAQIGNQIYLVGRPLDSNETIVQAYFPLTNKWELIIKMPEGRGDICRVNLYKIYCFNTSREIEKVDIYDTQTKKWTTRIIENRIRVIEVVSVGDKLYAIDNRNMIFRYDDLASKWEPEGRIDFKLKKPTLLVVGDYIIFIPSIINIEDQKESDLDGYLMAYNISNKISFRLTKIDVSIKNPKAVYVPEYRQISGEAIRGIVFRDIDFDGKKDVHEKGISNLLVDLSKAIGVGGYRGYEFYNWTYTDQNGNFSFKNLPLDSYLITVELPEQYLEKSALGGLFEDVALTKGKKEIEINFPYQEITQ